ncbi:MAG: Hpt domain-containing protein [Nitrospirales bacterium]
MTAQWILDATTCITSLGLAIQQNACSQIYEILHGIKGICRNMGAESFCDKCWLLEQHRFLNSQG